MYISVDVYSAAMADPNPRLRVNPGGMLIPDEVVGRDPFIASIWRLLEQRSVLLTSERRMGKTSVMRKMSAESPPGTCVIRTSLQGINAPEEFACRLVAGIEKEAPGVLSKPFVKGLRKSGLKKVAAKPVEVEFEPIGDDAWKEVVTGAFAAIDAGIDERVVFMWDELPHMIAAIAGEGERGPAAGRDVLDVLRFARETYPSIRMVLSGSIGIHHVVDRLRDGGPMLMPMHDMAVVDLPPLSPEDAAYLAVELLSNEGVECRDVNAVAPIIATEVDCVPYYVHHTVEQLQNGQHGNGELVDEERVRGVVEAAIADMRDPWQLRHYIDRVPVYYEQADLAYVVLDVVAAATPPISLAEVEGLVAARMVPPSAAELRDLVELLCKDYYLEPGYRFRLGLVRRAWQARRPSR